MPCGCSQDGYTLMEIIIVLALLGFMAGLALPRLERLYTSMQQSMQRSEALRCIADLGYQAWSQQQPLTLSRYPAVIDGGSERAQLELASSNLDLTEEIFPLPENWSVEAESPILYQRNGVCSGGTIIVRYYELESKYTLSAPFCFPLQSE